MLGAGQAVSHTLQCIPARHDAPRARFFLEAAVRQIHFARYPWNCAAAIAAAAFLLSSAPAHAQKYGGVLRGVLTETWPSLSMHEDASVSTIWPAIPMYSNLIVYDPTVLVDGHAKLKGELAERWSWSDGGKRLTFKLKHGVIWHDGKPFTSADVKYTFDLVRDLPTKRLKLNPRKQWYEKVAEIRTNGDFEVAFLLKEPQPGLLNLLASAYALIYPAHVDPAELRTRAIGTGPFMLKEAIPDDKIVMVRNPTYFVKGRPYLDALEYHIIKSRPARVAALQAGQIDMTLPTDTTVAVRDTIKASNPDMTVIEIPQGLQDNLLVNTRKPPFDNVKVRRAVAFALDRAGMIRTVHRGAAILGGAMLPPPYGQWGLTPADLAKLPGYGDPVKDKAQARRLLAEAGYGPSSPLKVTVSTRTQDMYTDTATWGVSELRAVGIDATLEQVETVQWFARLARRDFQIAINLTRVAADDPDANLAENYSCGSQRNYTDYCSKEMEARFEQASRESNPRKRLDLVRQIDRELQEEVARPILAHRLDIQLYWPYVKGIVPHYNLNSYGRMQDVWLDK
jgi:peptide/nickel transport system substrate-binding protein